MGYEFEYHPDGKLRFAHDLLNNQFDRLYNFDHVGRLVDPKKPAIFMLAESVWPGDPFDYSGGCILDGLPISCNQLLHKIDVGAVQAQGPRGLPGDVIHLGGGLIAGMYGAGSRPDLEDPMKEETVYKIFYAFFGQGGRKQKPTPID